MSPKNIIIKLFAREGRRAHGEPSESRFLAERLGIEKDQHFRYTFIIAYLCYGIGRITHIDDHEVEIRREERRHTVEKAVLDDEELRVKMLFAAEGTHVSRFGGEGTGSRSLTDIAWKVGEPVSARIEIEPDGTDHTAFSCFVKQGEGDWKLLAKFSTLGPAKPFLGCASFVEDFWRTPESARLSRRAVFSDFAYRAADGGEWVPANSVRFTGDDLKADNVDAGKVSEGAFYLQTGGDTKNKGIPIGTVAE